MSFSYCEFNTTQIIQKFQKIEIVTFFLSFRNENALKSGMQL